MLHVDFETRSTVDLLKCGAWRYAPHVTPLCMAYGFDGEPVELWLPHHPCPPRVAHHVLQGKPIAGWNAMSFERLVWRKVMTPQFGWPEPHRAQWVDPQAWARAMALPASLGECGRVLGLDEQKDKRGHKLIKLLCVPQGWTDDGEPIWNNDPALLAELYAYCVQDVVAERAIMPHLVKLTTTEQALLQFDSTVNDRGLGIDTQLVGRLRQVVTAETDRLNNEVARASEFHAMRASDLPGIRAMLELEGIDASSLGKHRVQELIKDATISDRAREVLQLRSAAAKASTAKLDAAINWTEADGRARGLFIWHGASTGRWIGVGIQPHNLPRASLDDAEKGVFRSATTIRDLMAGRPAADIAAELELPVLEIVSRLLRSCIIPRAGHDLWSCDLAGIESRVLAWLAGDEGKLDVFRAGRDPYVYNASGIYACAEADVTKAQRQIGKVAELALGFQGAVRAFQSMAATYGVVVPDEQAEAIVQLWRGRHPMVVAFWRALRSAAFAALQAENEDDLHWAGNRVAFKRWGRHLRCLLPSGRWLTYPFAKIMDVPRSPELLARMEAERQPGDGPIALTQRNVTFETKDTRQGRKHWVRISGYGGLWAENITQAVARDVLVHGLMAAERAGFVTVGHVHDEGLFEARPGATGAALRAAMISSPVWARGLPLDAAPDGPLARYRK